MPHKASTSGSAHVLDLRKARLAGAHLFAANDPIDEAMKLAERVGHGVTWNEQAFADAQKFARDMALAGD
jgi:hypothetical protein